MCTKYFFSFFHLDTMKDQENISQIDQYVIDYVRNLRIQKNLTQDGLASILGVGKSFISNAESLNHRAKYNLTHINALADYFNMKLADFLPDKPIPVNKSNKDKSKLVRVRISKSNISGSQKSKSAKK